MLHTPLESQVYKIILNAFIYNIHVQLKLSKTKELSVIIILITDSLLYYNRI